jgi:ATPase subunit of ABC transporter with duplicated ATPase domains
MINISTIFDLSINGHKLLENTQLIISNGEKYGLIGKNGIGKTTLMKLLLGKMEPLYGNIRRNDRLRIEYYSQHAIQELPQEMTAIEYIETINNKIENQYIRKLLGKIGLNGDLQQRPIKSLSNQ